MSDSDLVNDQFVDYDFTKDPNFVGGDLGRKAIDPNLCSTYEEVVPVLSRSRIMEECEKIAAAGGGAERLVVEVKHQGREGSCVGNATTQADQVVQAVQFGKENVTVLSASSLYKRIGRSPSSGAYVPDALEELVARGALPVDNEKNRAKYGDAVMPATGFYEKFPADWEKTAKKFAASEFHIVKSVDGLLTALCNQHPVVVGREGHSICYLRPMVKNGRLVVAYVNSWGKWGSGMGDFEYGFGFDTESQIRKSAGWAFALRTVVRPGI